MLFSAVELGVIDLLAHAGPPPSADASAPTGAAGGSSRGLTGAEVHRGIRMMADRSPSEQASLLPGGEQRGDVPIQAVESLPEDVKIDAVARLLDACVALGLLSAEDGFVDGIADEADKARARGGKDEESLRQRRWQRRYSLTTVSRQYLTGDSPTSLSGELRCLDISAPCLHGTFRIFTYMVYFLAKGSGQYHQ